jgi:hypothetical protein
MSDPVLEFDPPDTQAAVAVADPPEPPGPSGPPAAEPAGGQEATAADAPEAPGAEPEPTWEPEPEEPPVRWSHASLASGLEPDDGVVRPRGGEPAPLVKLVLDADPDGLGNLDRREEEVFAPLRRAVAGRVKDSPARLKYHRLRRQAADINARRVKAESAARRLKLQRDLALEEQGADVAAVVVRLDEEIAAAEADIKRATAEAGVLAPLVAEAERPWRREVEAAACEEGARLIAAVTVKAEEAKAALLAEFREKVLPWLGALATVARLNHYDLERAVMDLVYRAPGAATVPLVDGTGAPADLSGGRCPLLPDGGAAGAVPAAL